MQKPGGSHESDLGSVGLRYAALNAAGRVEHEQFVVPNGHSAIVGWLENGETWARYVSESSVLSQPVVLGPSPLHSLVPCCFETAMAQ